ncbi:DUF1796 family putative cysteine peptidase [Campylobacter upsaliensis]
MQNQINRFHNFKFPKIKTDFILSVGSHCRVAHHLRKNHLRNLASPLDWMINDKLEVVFELFKSDFKDFFLSCFIVDEKRKPMEVKDKLNGMISVHHFFSNEELEIQAQRINKQTRKRWVLIKDKICSSKNVVFMRSGEFDLETSKEFLHNVSKLFGSTGGGYTLINVSHNEKLKEDEMIMEKFDLGENLMIIHYSICENEKDFRGNIPFWTTMMQKSLIMPRGLKFKNALGDFKIRFIRSCKRRKAFFTKKIKVDINETH